MSAAEENFFSSLARSFLLLLPQDAAFCPSVCPSDLSPSLSVSLSICLSAASLKTLLSPPPLLSLNNSSKGERAANRPAREEETAASAMKSGKKKTSEESLSDLRLNYLFVSPRLKKILSPLLSLWMPLSSPFARSHSPGKGKGKGFNQASFLPHFFYPSPSFSLSFLLSFPFILSFFCPSLYFLASPRCTFVTL